MTDTTGTSPAALSELARSSVALMLRLQDDSGAFVASPTFSAYAGYCWFRDGAFIADAVSAAGEAESATRFFDWCARVVIDRADQIERIVAAAAAGTPLPDADMLPTRFTMDGGEGDDEWWDFQLDGYGTWMWAAAAHAQRHGLDIRRWARALDLTARYLVSSWRRPCFDWWEEHDERVHVSTLGCIVAGLEAGTDAGVLSERDATLAAVDGIRALMESDGRASGHLTKWIGTAEVDGSLAAIVAPLAVFPAGSPIGSATVDEVLASLEVGGGVYRFRADTYFGGGRWPLLSCFLGLALNARGDRAGALRLLEWSAGTADAAGDLPEQVTDLALDPGREEEWTRRWGPVARPLLWSHAMYVRLAVELGISAGVSA
ncbi:glycoside hydrolase family 15 protein [Galbitalea sp. SE-J8]|uniref:glycoside hydrolase family 15 protein n=1 Tax=Galbitalea sp. SE-J8 TaxID=3054952 RepID=UPI00259D0AC8|nr:glycoside hydrolase family 15 protein [Galbitalea sp. SE-J8]MDM4762081.1 glycoside hydrolase family 15 protein [Galbitalea sp. SE-J8]